MPTFDPIFRAEKKESEQKIETVLSDEEDNNNELGEKKIKLLNKENQDLIGSISFDYISKNESEFIKVRFAGIEDSYSRKDLSLDLYKQLINLAQQKKLNGICSDEVVQGGAIASWKKLQEQGFNVSVYPGLLNKYNEFCKTYNEGKYFKDQLATNNGESVFTLNLE